MKLLKIFALVLPVFGVAWIGGATPAAANTETLCVTGAYRANGAFVRGTRAEVARYRERRACRIALRRCRRRLDDVRWRTGRRMPYARCEIVEVYRISDSNAPGYYDDRTYSDRSCNYVACDEQYRSFRASDCSFKPYHGPRKRCTL